jgi:hypothetical protein
MLYISNDVSVIQTAFIFHTHTHIHRMQKLRIKDTVTKSSDIQHTPLIIFSYEYGLGGLSSSVGTATGYGLDGPGIESRWGRYFPYLSRPALGPIQPPVQWVPGLTWGYKTAGA